MARVSLGHADLDCLCVDAPADRDNGAVGVVIRMEIH